MYMSKCYLCLNKCFKKWFGTVKGVASLEKHYLCRKCGLIVGEKVTQPMGILDRDLELKKPSKESYIYGY